MKFSDVIARSGAATLAVWAAQSEYDRAAENLKKVRSMQPIPTKTDRLSSLSVDVAKQQEMIKKLEKRLKTLEDDVYWSNGRIDAAEEIIDQLSDPEI